MAGREVPHLRPRRRLGRGVALVGAVGRSDEGPLLRILAHVEARAAPSSAWKRARCIKRSVVMMPSGADARGGRGRARTPEAGASRGNAVAAAQWQAAVQRAKQSPWGGRGRAGVVSGRPRVAAAAAGGGGGSLRGPASAPPPACAPLRAHLPKKQPHAASRGRLAARGARRRASQAGTARWPRAGAARAERVALPPARAQVHAAARDAGDGEAAKSIR